MRYGVDCLDIVLCRQSVTRYLMRRESNGLSKASFYPNQKCPACMVGNAQQEIGPRLREHP